MRFGTSENPNLAELTEVLDEALPLHNLSIPGIEIRFWPCEGFRYVPGKKQRARTVVPVIANDVKIGDMHVLLFGPGDATGDESTFELGALAVPLAYQFSQDQQRVFPRQKTGILAEAMIPLFSARGDDIYFKVACLEELGVKNGEIVKIGDLGSGQVRFGRVVKDPRGYELQRGLLEREPQLTVGYRRTGERFGDPHAIYASRDFNIMQAAGFIAVSDANNPLAKVLDRL